MKPILLVAIYNENLEIEYTDFTTIKEAQEYADAFDKKADFHIFSLFSSGLRTAIQWDLNTDHATNLRENTKAQETTKTYKAHGRTFNAWTTREVSTAVENRKSGMKIKDIAKALGRTYNAVYCKLQAQKKIDKKIKLHG